MASSVRPQGRPALLSAVASRSSPSLAAATWTHHHPRASRAHEATSCRLQAPVRASGAAADSTAAAASPAASPAWSQHSWLWRGHRVRYITAGCGPPVVLVHGFGASSRHWRRSIQQLADGGYKVYALDLLGQGESAKPAMPYSMELWRDQVVDFMAEFVQAPAVLVGNSIGSLATLMAADAAPQAVAGLVLLNCAGGMNNKAIADDWRIKLALPLFWLIDFLLQRRSIAEGLFNRFRSPDNIRQVLKSVYRNEASVDDELVDLIYQPSCDEGALDAFVSIITGPPGPRPDRLLEGDGITQPLLVLWGDADPFTPADGPVGRFFQALPQSRPNTEFQFLPDVGHCPMDDRPELVNPQLLRFLGAVHG